MSAHHKGWSCRTFDSELDMVRGLRERYLWYSSSCSPPGRRPSRTPELVHGLQDGHWPDCSCSSPFVSEVKADSTVPAEEPIAYWGEATDPGNAVVRPEVVAFQPPADQPTQARDSLTKTVPKARIIPNRVVMTTSGAQYERWKQATSKELQAFPQDCLEGTYSRIASTMLR